jgi:hypothetical protein
MMPDEKLWTVLQTLSRDMSSVRAEVESVRREVVEMREHHIRETAKRDALAEQDAAVRALPARVAELERGHRPALHDADVRGWVWRLAALACGTAVIVAGIMAGIVTTLPAGALGVFGN